MAMLVHNFKIIQAFVPLLLDCSDFVPIFMSQSLHSYLFLICVTLSISDLVCFFVSVCLPNPPPLSLSLSLSLSLLISLLGFINLVYLSACCFFFFSLPASHCIICLCACVCLIFTSFSSSVSYSLFIHV